LKKAFLSIRLLHLDSQSFGHVFAGQKGLQIPALQMEIYRRQDTGSGEDRDFRPKSVPVPPAPVGLLISRLLQPLAGGRKAKPAVFHPFGANQPVTDFSEIVTLPLDDKDFHTMVGIQMDVDGGDNEFKKIMLEVGKNSGKFSGVMVVNDGNRPYRLLAQFPFLPYQAVPDQVANRFRSIPVAFLGNQTIKALKQGVFDRYSKTGDT
jgi:hypothetical protein